jgi:O-antigen/teichoic acid export membrane protein
MARAGRWRELALESVPVGIGTLLNTVAARIDISLLVLIVGTYQTGIYSAAYRIYGSLLNIPIAIFGAVLPAMASLGEKREGVRDLFYRSIASMLAIALPLAIAFSSLAGMIIRVLYGKTYAPAAEILNILSWSLIPAFCGMAFSHVILSQRRLIGRLPAIATVGMATNIVINLILIPKMGNRGAALSTLATETVLAILYAMGARQFLFGIQPQMTRSLADLGNK